MQRILLIRFFFFLAIPLFFVSQASGQDQTDQNWYFGNGPRGIQFTRPGDTARLVTRPTASITANNFGTAGSAVASDPVSGGLLFYTDGVNVYDATHVRMPNGNNIGGNAASNQPAVITKVPGQPGRYFIITNTAAGLTPGQINFSVVDSASFGNSVFPNLPLGDVTSKAQAVANLTTQSDAMRVIPHSNGTDFWLITHDAGTGAFRVTAINSSTITGSATPVTPPTGVTFTASHFAYDSVRNKLAVAPAEPGRNVMIFDFNETTGALTFDNNDGFVLNSATTGTAQPAIYDIEFSNNGEFLYVSRQGEAGTPGMVLQYDLTDPTVTAATVNTQPVFKSYGLQLAPDSSIYHIYQAVSGGPFLVGRIKDPDTVASAANYEPLPFGAVNFNATQFPAFLQAAPPSVNIDFTFSGTCASQPTTFFPEVVPGADSLVWDFGDGQSSTQWSPTHTYEDGGQFPVTVYAVVNGDTVGQQTKPVDITQFDLQVTLVQDTTACSCELRFPKADPSPTAYPNGQPCNPFTLTAESSAQGGGAIQWYGPSGLLVGQNTLTLSAVDSAGFYYVTVQDPNSGCFAYAGVNIKEYGVDDPRTNIWHFGNSAGIDFNPDFKPTTGADAIQGFITDGPEGVATISDQNGQVVISTDGEQVFDRDGNPLVLDPPGFGGNKNATQSSLIIPVASDPTLYYIFTTQHTDPQVVGVPTAYELRYAIFDLKIQPNGGIVDPDQDPSNGTSSVLFTRSTERITGNENWLIAHEFGTNNFRAYRITAEGLSSPVISSAGSDHSISSAEQGQGYMKLAANGQLAVAVSTPGVSNTVEIFDFDDATGVVSNPKVIDIGPAGQVYGVDISSSGQKLFATTKGPGALHEFRYDSLTETYVKLNTINAGADLGAIERGPDGTTYVAVNGSNALGTIQVNEDPDEISTFTEAGFPLLSGTTSTLGLPNFIQNIGDPIQEPTINASGLCHGLPTEFTGSGTDPIDTLIWNFGDGTPVQSGANLTSVSHTYDLPGTYFVILTIRNRCVGFVESLRDTVVINPNPEALSAAAALCNVNDQPLLAVAPGTDLSDLTFQWSSGETTSSISPQRDGVFDVIVRTAAGCLDTGRYEVFDARPRVDLGPDQTLCEDSDPRTFNANNPGAQYAWTVNGAQVSTNQRFTFNPNTPSPPSYQVAVTVTDPFTTCDNSDTVTYIVNPNPVFTALGNDPIPPCGSPTGSIDLSITSTGNYFYNVTGPGSSGLAVTQAGPAAVNVPGLAAGTYNVQVSDQISGCFERTTVGLSDNAFDVAIARALTCNDVNGLMPVIITLTGTPPPAPTSFSYRILESNTSQGTPILNANTNPFTTAGVENGDYVAEVVAGGCTSVSPITNIEQDAPVPIDDVVINECVTPITLTATAPLASFAWTGPNIVGPTNVSAISATPPSGQHDYKLVVSAPSFCNADTTVTVNVGLDPPATLVQSDPCLDQVTLSASPTGNYVYRWFRNGTQFVGGQQVSVTTADNGFSYQVDVRNTINGCFTSDTETVAVLGELTVDISNPATCAGADFTLTATTNQTPDFYQWALNRVVIPTATTNALTVTDDREGMYRVIVQRSAAGRVCIAKDSVNITVNPTTPGLLPETGIICPEHTEPRYNEVTLNPGEEFASYNWFKDGDELAVTTPTLTVNETGTYTVDLLNIYNCPSSDRITLIEECNPLITGPNAFRPGGLNKEFSLFTFFIDDEDFEIFIFNRWGEMVFYSNEREFKWNGGYKNNTGQPSPPGTYAYLVKYKSSYRPEDGVEEYRGGVVLLR